MKHEVRWAYPYGSRKFKTKKAAQHRMKVWKRWYERCGWTVIGSVSTNYRAYPPGWGNEPIEIRGVTANQIGRVHVIAIR